VRPPDSEKGLARIGGREHAAHGPLISSVIVAAVPLAGLSFGFAYNMLGLSVRGVSDGGTFSCWKNGLGTENRPANWWTLRC
jgi:hypothetical protein